METTTLPPSRVRRVPLPAVLRASRQSHPLPATGWDDRRYCNPTPGTGLPGGRRYRMEHYEDGYTRNGVTSREDILATDWHEVGG